MATQPWVTPKDVVEYTEYPSVRKRSETKLTIDISRAEQYIIALTNNKFEDYEEIPSPVKTAVILVAEAYAYNASLQASEMKSETFDDYSYTLADASPIDLDLLDIKPLLEEFMENKTSSGVFMRMRKL